MLFLLLNSTTCNVFALSFPYSSLLAFLLRFSFLNSTTCNTFALSFPYSSLLAFLLRFSFLNSTTCNTFAVSLPYFVQLATVQSFLNLIHYTQNRSSLKFLSVFFIFTTSYTNKTQHIYGILPLTFLAFSLESLIYQGIRCFLLIHLHITQLATRLRYPYPYFFIRCNTVCGILTLSRFIKL